MGTVNKRTGQTCLSAGSNADAAPLFLPAACVSILPSWVAFRDRSPSARSSTCSVPRSREDSTIHQVMSMLPRSAGQLEL
jgi:hypothetical protein